MNGEIWLLGAEEVKSILDGHRALIIDAVSSAYRLHAEGATSLPHSTFLRFPHLPGNRIIALPAYVGGEIETAGIKWIASAPANIHRGLERASALIVLNDPETGIPWAVLEGSHISAARTAASAALAAKALHSAPQTRSVGLVGCGRINFEVAAYLREVFPELSEFVIFDLDQKRLLQFRELVEHVFPGTYVTATPDLQSLLAGTKLISLATTAATPHIFDLTMCSPGTTILHLSLRDLSPEIIRANNNVVDDLDHVCRAQTSIHLAQQVSGTTDFVSCSLGEVLLGKTGRSAFDRPILIFSPFGLGILDMAVGRLVCDQAMTRGSGFRLKSFLPAEPWNARLELQQSSGSRQ